MASNFDSWLDRVELEVLDVTGELFYCDSDEEDLLHQFFREGMPVGAAAQLLLLYRELGASAIRHRGDRRETTAGGAR